MRRVSLSLRLRTYAALGLASLARVAVYRLAVRWGVHPVQRLRGTAPAGPFFAPRPSPPPKGAIARMEWQEDGPWFGVHAFATPSPPDWHASPFTGGQANAMQPWFALPDFDPTIGDIKEIWEVSRLDWLLAMAQRAAMGRAPELARLNRWLESWVRDNPPYHGVNWKCGQEASIRVLHCALAALLLDQAHRPLPGLLSLVRLHLARIAPTVSYAIGQQNNHGTSEAAALFIGGSWLESLGDRSGAQWARLGRRMLEERAHSLIAPDGSFSQYSLVYHRLMLDSYALVESWRRRWGLPAFSERLRVRLGAATVWLQAMVDPVTGDGPNYGANDGARLAAMTDTGHRDFRPSLQWAATLFLDARAIAEPGPWDQPLCWLGLPRPVALLPGPTGGTFDNGGLHVLRQGRSTAYLRYPRFRFRPSQCDALHLDLWVEGRNVLRDAGSYSYAAPIGERDYFSGVAAHNSVQFDDREQMPRLGRFLLGAWPHARQVAWGQTMDGGVEAGAAYTDWRGATHDRRIRLDERRLLCTDRLGGTAERAVMRWRLNPGSWRQSGTSFTDGRTVLTVEGDDPEMRVTLGMGLESRYYLGRRSLPVVEVTVRVPAILLTRIGY